MARKDMSGYIAENENQTNPKAPQHKGICTINGVDYWISGWDNDGDKGPYVGLKFQRKEDKKEHSESKANAYQPKQPTYVNQEDVKTSCMPDDIPF